MCRLISALCTSMRIWNEITTKSRNYVIHKIALINLQILVWIEFLITTLRQYFCRTLTIEIIYFAIWKTDSPDYTPFLFNKTMPPRHLPSCAPLRWAMFAILAGVLKFLLSLRHKIGKRFLWFTNDQLQQDEERCYFCLPSGRVFRTSTR